MSIQCGLAADLDEILQNRRTRNAGLGNDDATSAKNNIVSDLHEIIETRTCADHRVLNRSSIDRRIGADLDVVFEDHPAELGSRQEPGLVGPNPNPSCPMRAPG